jgi:UTP-glucose-1-phosphate uridylyltransferase
MKAALVIMAAGMGSRYGGNKQVDGLGPNGEILMEYSIYDAIRAGFNKVVFIIKPDMKELMEDLCGRRIAQMKANDGSSVEVAYAFQDFSSVPSWYKIPAERVKPFGTAHAVLCARDVVKEPFAVINADDYYGADAFPTIYNELCKLPEKGAATMVGYRVDKTVSENGTVTRGVCQTENGKLTKIVETFKIKLYPNGDIRDIETARTVR